jgi:hypothetical protein
MAEAGGAADRTRVENVPPNASALAPTSMSRREGFQNFIGVSSIRGYLAFSFFAPARCYPDNARQRSAGKCSHTALPCGMLFDAAVTARNCVPSLSSSM